MTQHIIDCDADPIIPNGWEVVEHIKGGQFEWNPDKLELYLSEKQKNGGYIAGTELREELRGTPVLNLNVANFLVNHPERFPSEWKEKRVYFWGTICRGGRYLHVPYLYVHGDWVVLFWRWLDRDWRGREPAVRFASPLSSEVSNQITKTVKELEKLQKMLTEKRR